MLKLFADKLSKLQRQANLSGQFEYALCGYATKGFNVPFLNKRLLINGIELPAILHEENLKPWDATHLIDVSNEWKMTSFESYTSFETICTLFDVEHHYSSPEVIKGSYNNGNYNAVVNLAESKLHALAMLYLRLKGIKNEIIKLNR